MTPSALLDLTRGKAGTEVLDEVASDVRAVEEELARLVQSHVDLVGQVGKHTLEAGGKRLRPAFLTLAAKACAKPFLPKRAIELGACLEMIHMATLIHDDVIDHAATRRGRPTAAVRFGNAASILSGDVFLAKAMAILAQDGDLEMIRVVSRAVVEVAEGEVREVEVRGQFDLPLDDHLRILRMKTAALVECCCHAGALVAGAESRTVEGLRTYGHHVGMAFQIADDVLDYRGDQEATGKPRATDFAEGCATLPLILLREALGDADLAFWRARFGHPLSPDETAALHALMTSTGAYVRSLKRAGEHVDQALQALDVVPNGPARDLLAAVTGYVVDREA